MHKFKTLILILFLTNYGFSQHIEVDYKLNAFNLKELDELKGVPKSAIESLKESFELIKLIKMHLVASKTESYCSSNTTLVNDVNSENFREAQIIAGSEDIYHTNLLDNKNYRYFSAYGEKVVMETNIKNLKWTITKESKIIGNYICYKATTNYLTKNSIGTFSKKVVAYYTPKINYNFGPKGYFGLPGLILELQDDRISYIVDTIKFMKDDIEQYNLPKGKLVTQEELDQIGQKIRENSKW